MKPHTPPLLFLHTSPTLPAGLSGFAGYFAERGYSCYAMDATRGVPLHLPDQHRRGPASALDTVEGPALIALPDAARTAMAALRQESTLSGAGRCRAAILLAPPLPQFWSLLLRPPATATWIGYGARQRSLRILALLRGPLPATLTLHAFQGLGPELHTAPSWERVAYAIRTWLASRFPSPPFT